MKRNEPGGGSGRLTSGSLPVPLFNQKKRVRQPFTSSPGAAAETQDFPPLPADFVWEMTKPEVPPWKKMLNARQQLPAEHHLKQGEGHQANPRDVARGRPWSSWSFQEDGPEAWDAGPSPGPRSWEMNPKRRQPGMAAAGGAPGPSRGAGAQGPGGSSGSPRTPCQNQLKTKALGGRDAQGKVTREGPAKCPAKLQDGPSLRIVPAGIESMKRWRELAARCPLLFEVLAVLDSAVTPGAQGAKSFLLRDGRSAVPCVFYETDRELPRLIRGRVHRCVGTYDPDRKLFRCVSVRPATVSEQKTFQELVRTADAAMSRCSQLTGAV
ncbi:spermatogenesis-associated protein 22 isoform X1 [Monodelphis domestica]|uniref:spermatogenesis-associated protein 22 isoform X1 n=2 Tax=Monodelphis domestica TaxID=13616 RepID=UPI0024E257BD|nr:spermatogenesis-associated protein 22 isoform X1 [Monodelphis domestica]